LCVGLSKLEEEAPPYFKQFQIGEPNTAKVQNINTVGDIIGAQDEFTLLKVGSEFIGTRQEIERVAKKMRKSTDVPIPDLDFPTKMTNDWIHSLPLANKEREQLDYRFSHRMHHPLLLLLLLFFVSCTRPEELYVTGTMEGIGLVLNYYWIGYKTRICSRSLNPIPWPPS
jgi:hypothetical protein